MIREKEDTLYIVMPAYNEEDNIRQVVVSWLRILKYGSGKSRLVVADSGSTDKTHDILLELKKKNKQLEILEDTDQFHGPKVIALYRYAIEKGADYIFQTDSDGQTDPGEFNTFWIDRKKYDGIIGYRKKRGDGRVRAFVERVVCCLLNVFFGVNVPDANAPFRLMSASMVKKYIYRISPDYALPNIILTAYFARFKEKILFKMISFAPRTKGNNSINVKKIIKIGFESLFAFFSFRKDMRILEIGSEVKFKNDKRKKIGVIICFGLLSFILIVISPAFFWNSDSPMTDSSVFLTIGRQMKNGEVPYANTFDHKGPLLYLINYFGIMIEDISGIFVFEFFAVFFTLFFIFKIVKLKVSNYTFSVVLTIILFSPFISFYLSDWGNLVEQYALPFISFSLYIFLKYFMNKNVSVLEITFVGAAFASVLLLRVNMVGVWAVFCPAVLVKDIYRKNYTGLRRNIAFFSFGALLVIMPIVIWLLSIGAFSAFIDAYVSFNMEYSDVDAKNVFSSILFFMDNMIIFLSFVLTFYYAIRDRKDRIMILYLGAFVAAFIAACISGKCFLHYGMTLVPLVVFPFASLFADIEDSSQFDTVGVVSLLFLMFLVSPIWLDVTKLLCGGKKENNYGRELISKICEYIEEKTNSDDKIIVYGNWNQIYIRCNRLPASRYSYQFPITDVRPTIMDEFYNDLLINKPKVFVVQPGFMNQRTEAFLRENGYGEAWSEDVSDGAKVYFLIRG